MLRNVKGLAWRASGDGVAAKPAGSAKEFDSLLDAGCGWGGRTEELAVRMDWHCASGQDSRVLNTMWDAQETVTLQCSSKEATQPSSHVLVRIAP